MLNKIEVIFSLIKEWSNFTAEQSKNFLIGVILLFAIFFVAIMWKFQGERIRIAKQDLKEYRIISEQKLEKCRNESFQYVRETEQKTSEMLFEIYKLKYKENESD